MDIKHVIIVLLYQFYFVLSSSDLHALGSVMMLCVTGIVLWVIVLVLDS